MSKKLATLVLGYNNTRVNDVKKIRTKCSEYLKAITILCKKNPTDDDRAAADYVIDVDLEATDENVNKVLEELKKLSIDVIALLPFSDPGTQLAAALSGKFPHLKCPDDNKIKAALDKHTFRELENESTHFPTNYKKIKSEKITSFDHLISIHKELNGKIFLKPAKEGNSRGCINLTVENDLKTAWAQVNKYLADGIVAEELIVNGVEYSWDHVNGYSWITEKKTTSNQYSAEFQQIVPAPLSQDVSNSISTAGEFMAELAGYNHGACHNEVFYFPHSGDVSGVEPNLRPAGGRIWDLACLAFDDFDSWKEWILWASSSPNTNNNKKILKQNYYAGLRKIQAPRDGMLNAFVPCNIADLSAEGVEFVELVWTKKIGDAVSHIAKDNSDYIGYVIAKSKSYENLNKTLEIACINLQNMVSIS